MIESNNLILNLSVTPIPDASISLQETSTSDEKIEIEDINDEVPIIDPGSFMVLMTQLLTDNSSKTAAITEDSHIEKQPVVTDPKVSEQPQPISTSTNIQSTQNDPIILEDNVAMAWINSESYIPPQSMVSSKEMGELSSESEADFVSEESTINEFFTNNENENVIPHKVTNDPMDDLKEDLFRSLKILNESSPESSPALAKSAIAAAIEAETKPRQEQESIFAGNGQNMVNINHTSTASVVNDSNEVTTFKTLNIPVDVASEQWADQFSEHIVWMGQQGVKSALIKLHPEDLGPLEISVKVVKDSATVNISSHNDHVRDIVEQSLPRLRDMLAEQGLNLSETHIGSDTNSSRQSAQNDQNSNQGMETDFDDDVFLTPLKKRSSHGLIDYFA